MIAINGITLAWLHLMQQTLFQDNFTLMFVLKKQTPFFLAKVLVLYTNNVLKIKQYECSTILYHRY